MSSFFLQGFISDTQNTRPLINLAERAPTQDEMMRRNNDNLSARIRVAIPAQVVSFNASNQTIVAQPLIREKMIDRATGDKEFIQLPTIPDVPVHFPQAGNFVLTMPITAGDEVLLIFNDMCIDSWWASGGVQNWNDRRRHDLSDAIAIPGINSVPNVIPGIASDAAELRTKDGAISVSIDGDSITMTCIGLWGQVSQIEIDKNMAINPLTPNDSITLTATNININGTLKHNGNNYVHHVHAVSTAPGVSGPVTEIP